MLFFLPLLSIVLCVHWLFLYLDELLFPAYRQTPVRAPVFMVGVPRSGTTFLHRVLASDPRFTTFSLLELALAPSITQRKIWLGLRRVDGLLGRPGARSMQALEGVFLGRNDAVHKLALDTPEEDFLLLTLIGACFIMVAPFPFAEELWRLGRFDRDVPPARRREIMTFYRRCVQRHLYVHGPGKTFLSKNVSFTPMIDALAEEFPDCRIVANLRHPIEAVPSQLSAMRGAMRLFGVHRQARAFDERLRAVVRFDYEHIIDDLPRLPPERHLLIDYAELRGDLGGLVRRIYARFGIEMSDSIFPVLKEHREANGKYRSRHKYSLERFGLTREQVLAEYADLLARYPFDATPPPENKSEARLGAAARHAHA